MTHPPPYLLFFRGRGLISTAIRWQTRGHYSHVGVLLPSGRVLEAWQGSGVRITELDDWTGVDRYFVEGMTAHQWTVALEFMRRQLGKGYDYWAICRFVSRKMMPENDRWFCSELVFAGLLHAGVTPLARINAAAVSPGMLSLSPLLHKIEP